MSTFTLVSSHTFLTLILLFKTTTLNWRNTTESHYLWLQEPEFGSLALKLFWICALPWRVGEKLLCILPSFAFLCEVFWGKAILFVLDLKVKNSRILVSFVWGGDTFNFLLRKRCLSFSVGLCNILNASCPSARWSTEELSPGEILVTAFVSLSFDIFHNYFKSTMIWDCRFHKLSYPNKHRSFSCMLLLFLYEWSIWLVFKIYEAFLFWCSFLRDNRIALPASVSKGNLHWAVVKMRVNKSVFINNAAARGVFR